MQSVASVANSSIAFLEFLEFFPKYFPSAVGCILWIQKLDNEGSTILWIFPFTPNSISFLVISGSVPEYLKEACTLSRSVWLFATLWTIACQAPLSMGFFRQEYWSGWHFPPPGDLPDPGMEPAPSVFHQLQADTLPAEPWRKPP